MRKTPGTEGTLVLDRGFEGDAHAGDWHRQVSLLAPESIDTMQAKGLDVDAGDFAENITTKGIDLLALPVGSVIKVGESAVLEISQIGKVCHTKCAIYYQAGDCVMPREGIFAVVREPGDVRVGDAVVVVSLGDGTCDRTPPEAIAEFERERAAEAAELRREGRRLREGEVTCAVAGLKIGILTCSDTRTRGRGHRGSRAHRAGRGARAAASSPTTSCPDDRAMIADMLDRAWPTTTDADVVLTCGGTGLSPRDVTPEATRDVSERLVPGIAEYIRAESLLITDRAMLSRATAVQRGTTLIINFPGSEKAARESFGFVAPQLEHAVEMTAGGGHG